MPFVELRALSKSFGDHPVLSGIELTVEEGEVLALLGPSGSGKTTLLRLLAGFESPDEGAILVGGEDVVPIPPARRAFGMVFQHYALFPHMTVGENVAFGLDGWGLPAERKADRIAEVLELVDLAGFEDRAVTRISGGQQQRVALARAVAPKPRLLLLDEPLSNLDPELRERTRRRLREMLTTIGVTTVLVTHEQDEAFDLGDRVAVLAEGRLQQVDSPEILYREPANRFVAGFIGRSSFLTGRMVGENTAAVGRDPGGDPVLWEGVVVPGRAGAPSAPPADPDGGAVVVAVRPEALELVAARAPGSLAGHVVEQRFIGMVFLVLVELEGGERLEVATRRSAAPGDPVGVARLEEGPRPRIFAAQPEVTR
jgi:ABC-type Fe3+/spermidine/putrescine transport system ATPase subunit